MNFYLVSIFHTITLFIFLDIQLLNSPFSSNMAHNGCGYVACPVGSGRCSYPPDKFTLKQDKILIDQPWGMRCTRCWCLYFSSLSQSVLRLPVRWPKEIFARWLSEILTPNFPAQRSFLMQFS